MTYLKVPTNVSIVVIQNFLLPWQPNVLSHFFSLFTCFSKLFQGGVPFTLIFNKNLPYDVESAIARFGNHGAVPLIKLNELNMRGRVPGEFLYFLVFKSNRDVKVSCKRLEPWSYTTSRLDIPLWMMIITRFWENTHPGTPPLSQHFILSEK